MAYFVGAATGRAPAPAGHLVGQRDQQCGRMLSDALPEGSRWGAFDLVVPQTERVRQAVV